MSAQYGAHSTSEWHSAAVSNAANRQFRETTQTTVSFVNQPAVLHLEIDESSSADDTLAGTGLEK
jgi:hypothetical protein